MKLRGHGADFLSPTRLAFMNSGSSGCMPTPTTLAVASAESIRIWLKDEWPSKAMCPADLVGEPVVIAINPKLIDVHHRLTIHLSYPLSKHPVVFTARPLT
jgi:hypothetical protein